MVRTAARPAAGVDRPVPQRRQLLAIGLLIAAFLVFFPTKQLVVQKIRMHRLETRLAELDRTNARLEAEVERMQDPAELELFARERLGLVKPGEDAYLFVPAPTPPPTPAPTEAETQGWAERVAERILRLIRGRPSGPPAPGG